jgi:acyl-CoA thioester hydrolase
MRIDLQLRWSDQDQFGHINNAVYATLFEEARARLFLEDKTGADLLNLGIVVIQQDISYLAPLYFTPAPVECEISVTKIGNTSFTFHYQLFDRPTKEPKSALVATGTSVMVAVDLDTKKPKRLSEPQIVWLRSHQELAGWGP